MEPKTLRLIVAEMKNQLLYPLFGLSHLTQKVRALQRIHHQLRVLATTLKVLFSSLPNLPPPSELKRKKPISCS